jgi:hypothetical protein
MFKTEKFKSLVKYLLNSPSIERKFQRLLATFTMIALSIKHTDPTNLVTVLGIWAFLAGFEGYQSRQDKKPQNNPLETVLPS